MAVRFTQPTRPLFKTAEALFQDLTRLFDTVSELVKAITTIPLLGTDLSGVLLKNVAISTAETNVVHNLGRPYVGWVVTRKRGNATIFEVAAQPNTSTTLRLDTSANVTIDLWIF